MMLAAPTAPNIQASSTTTQSTTTNPSSTITTKARSAADDCSSSTSPTNTSTSDASMDMLASLMNAGAAAAAVAAANPSNPTNSIVKQEIQESPPLHTPPVFLPDAVTLLQFSQLFQAQQAVAQFQAQAVQQRQQHLQHQQQLQQQQQQQQATTATQERKRSYPCTFQYCVICQKDVHSSKLPCHIRQCHVSKPMFQCPACDFTSTYSKNNVKSHMVSLHGLAGDPISYMDKYAGQVEEYMKLCFPNVRGRGRPMQGRSSPKSPVSPSQVGRRASQASIMAANAASAAAASRRATVSQNDLLASLAQQQQQQQQHQQQQHQAQTQNNTFNPLRNLRFNPLQSIFPSVLANNNNNNNNNNSILASNKHNFLMKQEEKEQHQTTNHIIHDNEKKANVSMSSSPSCSNTKQQPIRVGENAQPRYVENGLQCITLNDLQTKETIFADFRNNMEIYIENISRKIHTTTPYTFKLSDELRSKVEEVRNRINIQLFEVMFAIHRMDTKILDVRLVELLIQIAPTNCDSQLLRKIENVSDPNEEFLIGLTKIDHIEEKLETMSHMHQFEQQVNQLKERIQNFDSACERIQESRSLRMIMQLILAIMNIGLFEDKQCLSINGFPINEILKVLNISTQSGQSIRLILGTILKDEINVDLEELFNLSTIIEKVYQDDFMSLYLTFSQLDDKTLRAEREMEHSGTNNPLSEFVEYSKNTLKMTWNMLQLSKQNLINLTSYLGNQLPYNHEIIKSDQIFGNLLEFLKNLKTIIETDEDMDSDDQHINILSP